MEDLRDHLFATIEGLLDKDDALDIDRAKAVALVAGKLIDSAKVEVELIRVTDGRQKPTAFLEGKTVPALENKAS